MFPLKDGVVTIGRDPASDIQIDSLAVEPQHARLVINGDSCTLSQGKHDNKTYVNHTPVKEQVLAHNDIIRIGKHVLVYHEDALVNSDDTAAEITAPPVAETFSTSTAAKEQPKTPIETNGWLQVMNGKMLGKTFKLRSGLTDLGKLGMLPALIALRSGGYFISNLADDDSISVADETIGDKSHPLHDGDLIKLGKVTLQFHIQT